MCLNDGLFLMDFTTRYPQTLMENSFPLDSNSGNEHFQTCGSHLFILQMEDFPLAGDECQSHTSSNHRSVHLGICRHKLSECQNLIQVSSQHIHQLTFKKTSQTSDSFSLFNTKHDARRDRHMNY